MRMHLPPTPLTAILLLTLCLPAWSQDRIVPPIPPTDRPIPVIIDSDAKNEIDDQWALALALLRHDRFAIEGFVGATFRESGTEQQFRDRVTASTEEIRLLLELAGASGRWPVYEGSIPMPSMSSWHDSEGVDFIIERARAHTPEDPLWVVVLGAATDITSAYLKAPDIRDRVVVFWHGRSAWPTACRNFNAKGDRNAARLLFESDLPFVLFDTGTHLTVSMAESERYTLPYGELGAYLHEYRYRNSYFQDGKAMFDLGDIAALVDPSIGSWEVVDCPTVDADLLYDFSRLNGRILRCSTVDRDATFDLLYAALAHTDGVVDGGDGIPPNSLTPDHDQLCTAATFTGASTGWSDPAYPVAAAHDGNLLSDAHAEGAGEHWIEYAFDGPHALERIRLYEDDGGNYSTASWRLAYRRGGIWSDAFAPRAADAPGWHEVLLDGIVADAIRIYATGPTGGGLEIVDLACYGAPDTGGDLISAATFTAASAAWNTGGAYALAAAHDDDPTSETHAETAGEAWLEYDLGGAHALHRARVREDDGGGYSLGSWRLEALVDGTWIEALPPQPATGAGWHEAELNGIVASRVRLLATPPAGSRLEIYEFECHGAPVAGTSSPPELTVDVIVIRGRAIDPDGAPVAVTVAGNTVPVVDGGWEIALPVAEGVHAVDIIAVDGDGLGALREVLIDISAALGLGSG